MILLVLGAGGQLGQTLVERLSQRHEVVARARTELDISDQAAVLRTVHAVRPAAIINCAAYTNVDGAEAEPERAIAVNAQGPRTLARASKDVGAALVHYSTDFVFDGRASQPYSENDLPRPQGVYAASKLLGEWFASEAPRAYVLRVESLFGGPRAKSSVDLLLNAIVSDREARAFSDRTVSPGYVDDVADATAALLEGEKPAGVYHCVNTGSTTWLGLAEELARLTGKPAARITPIRLADAKLNPPRPQYAALSNTKLANAGIAMPAWQDALGRYVGSKGLTGGTI